NVLADMLTRAGFFPAASGPSEMELNYIKQLGEKCAGGSGGKQSSIIVPSDMAQAVTFKQPELAWFPTEVMKLERQQVNSSLIYITTTSALIDAFVQEFARHINHPNGDNVAHFGVTPSDP